MKIFLFFVILSSVISTPEKVIKESLNGEYEIVSITPVQNDENGVLRDFIQRLIWNCNYEHRKKMRYLTDFYGTNADDVKSVEIIEYTQKINALNMIKTNTKLTSMHVYYYYVRIKKDNKTHNFYYILSKDNKIVGMVYGNLLNGIFFDKPVDFVTTMSNFYVF